MASVQDERKNFIFTDSDGVHKPIDLDEVFKLRQAMVQRGVEIKTLKKEKPKEYKAKV